MKKLILPLLAVALLLLAESALAFHTGRDYLRAQLLFRSPDAGPIYFRGGLISNLYGDLPAKYSPQDGQIYFPHYFLGAYGYPGGVFSYRPSDYLLYGQPYWNYGAYAGYYPEPSYGTYSYDWPQYTQRYGLYGYPYSGYSGYGSGNYGYGSLYGNYGYGGLYGNYGYGSNYGYSGYGGNLYGGYNGYGTPYGQQIYTGYGNDIYPGPFGYDQVY